MIEQAKPTATPESNYREFLLCLLPVFVYFFSNPKPQHYYDYTFRVAENFLRGGIAFTERQPSWLNEFVPFDGLYYSVFPLGSVLTMVPFALLKVAGLITDMPAAFIAAITAAAVCILLLAIGDRYDLPVSRIVLLTAGVLFGTWMWTNLTMGGAWQLALGFAMVGELGAIYFTVYDRRPAIAGAFFALAFGNRTEVLLTAPIFMYLLVRAAPPAFAGGGKFVDEQGRSKKSSKKLKQRKIEPSPPTYMGGAALRLALFCAVPFALGVATLVYNYVRFHSFSDFGYARIPGVLNEPWYKHGIFSYHYIPGQIWEMLWRPWETRSTFPYIIPNGFSSSVLWSSPFLLFAFRTGARDRVLKYLAWAAILLMAIILWMHGNSGGWQFGYRYAMVLLPWLFVIMLESSPKKISPFEWAAYVLSFLANAYATWLFHWTNYLKP